MDEKKVVRLTSIKLMGFQSKNKILELDFAKGNISIIYGENGSGKTTFLKVMNAILKQDATTLYNNNISNIDISYSFNGFIKEVNIPFLNISNEETQYSYNWSKFNSSEIADTSSLSFGIERGMVASSLKIDTRDILEFLRHPKYRRNMTGIDLLDFSESLSDYLRRTNLRRSSRYIRNNDELSIRDKHAYLQNIKISNIEDLLLDRYKIAKNIATEQIQNALFDTLTFIFDNQNNIDKVFEIENDFIDSLLNNKERLIEALDNGVDENKFKKNMIKKLKQVNDKKNLNSIINNKILYTLIKNMIKELEVEKRLLSSINTFVDYFNEFLSDNKKLIINYDSIYIEIENKKHNIDVLSSGERHIFTFLSLIIIEGNLRNFIFIDEPEISLNIKWQRILMQLITELAPDTQIIAASHSPLIAKRIPESLVELKTKRT
ncbi:AAA family ATPase [Aliarcobacter cryaerophilus]|uniref:AAA family ATPase n=1 Tax=Aliarcobacter cryaerophilus TaxID=28198 RepID=UPI000825867F|nr:AAA family ATPase [Aliarcobacter cryaerophilus]